MPSSVYKSWNSLNKEFQISQGYKNNYDKNYMRRDLASSTCVWSVVESSVVFLFLYPAFFLKHLIDKLHNPLEDASLAPDSTFS